MNLEELANLWPLAIVVMERPKHGTHGAGFRVLILDLTVNDLAALRGVDGFELGTRLAHPKVAKDSRQETTPAGRLFFLHIS